MLVTVTGPFHPVLESALVEDIQTLKAEDPWAPLLVVVPSDALRRRLKHLLCLEHHLALVQVEILTFHQLALHVLEDREPARLILPSSDPFFPELVRSLLVQQSKHDPAWSGLVSMPGAWQALWATLKDLKDAGVQAEAVTEAVDQAPAELVASLLEPPIKRLFSFYQAFLEAADSLRVADPDDLPALAVPHVPASTFLGRQRRIFYYGFYDLTQCQLDFFQAIAKAFPTVLFFPLVPRHPGFRFAEQFFDRYIRGLGEVRHEATERGTPSLRSHVFAQESVALPDPEAVPSSGRGELSTGPECRIIQASGKEDEVSVIAKEILMLVEERGYQFHHIGVVGRTLAGYEETLPRIFAEQGIPFDSTLGRPLAGFPYVKTALQLLGLRGSRYRRDLVIDLVKSPFFDMPAQTRGSEPVLSRTDHGWRPDLWDLASRRLGIVKTLDEWHRLDTCEAAELPLSGHHDEDEQSRIPGEVIRSLRVIIERLSHAFDGIPEEGSWSTFVRHAETLCGQFLTPVPEWEPDEEASSLPNESRLPHGAEAREGMQRVAEAFQERLRALNALDRLEESVPFMDFVETLAREIERGTVPIHPFTEGGRTRVQVLDAMTARGLPFRALFILGLNENVFPRPIREDPFLHDRVRRTLVRDLGYKIPEKLAGHDEEKLLLTLLANAATDDLVCVYQRSDEEGRPMVPSLYVDELRRPRDLRDPQGKKPPSDRNQEDGPGEMRVPRRWREKVSNLPHYRDEHLTPGELILHRLLEHRIPRALLREYLSSESGAVADRGLAALHHLESAAPGLGAYDGITGPLEAFWASIKTGGISPTPLERYAECPFHYFAAHVLQVVPFDSIDDVEEVGPLDLGTLVHDMLAGCFRKLREQGYFRDRASRPGAIDPASVLEEVARPILEAFAQSHPVGYPLVWEIQQERLLAGVTRFLRCDLARMEEGWEPVLFETPVKGNLTLTLPHGEETVPLKGRIDRVDWLPVRRSFRIIDYKFRMARGLTGKDRNLETGAIRGLRLQPPLYLRAARTMMPDWLRAVEPFGGENLGDPAEERGKPECEGVWFYFLVQNSEPSGKRAEADADADAEDAEDAEDVELVPVLFPGDAWTRLGPALEHALVRILGNIQQGLFFINPGEHCARCPYTPMCRKMHQPSAWRARVDDHRLGPYRAMRRAKAPGTGSKRARSSKQAPEASDA